METNPENLSDITKIEAPQFQSRIPAYLLEGKSESEQFILNEVSKMGHFCEWIAPIIISSNQEARKTNGRVKRLEANVGDLDIHAEVEKGRDFRKMFKSWWMLVGGLFALIAALAGVVQVAAFLVEKWPK